jgi:hypothetical protein
MPSVKLFSLGGSWKGAKPADLPPVQRPTRLQPVLNLQAVGPWESNFRQSSAIADEVVE